MADAERRRKVALLAAQQDAETNAERARTNSAAEQDVAKAKGVIRREEAASMKVYRLAEAKAEAEETKAENTRSDALMALEAQRINLDRLPAIVSEMVKSAEKINEINVNQFSGLDRSGNDADTALGQVIGTILDMAVTLPAIKKIVDSIGVNLDTPPAKSDAD